MMIQTLKSQIMLEIYENVVLLLKNYYYYLIKVGELVSYLIGLNRRDEIIIQLT